MPARLAFFAVVNPDNLPRRPAAGCQGGHCSTRFTSHRGKNHGKDDNDESRSHPTTGPQHLTAQFAHANRKKQ